MSSNPSAYQAIHAALPAIRSKNQTVIRVENLSKRFHMNAYQANLRDSLTTRWNSWMRKAEPTEQKDILWALQDISFELRLGETLGIIGPNGAGKTTLLRILSRVTSPTKGYVAVNGRLGGLLELKAGFHPELTGRENIFLYGSILGLQRREINRKFDEIVQFSGVERFIDTPVKRYSSGMAVRLGFSVAAQTDPDLLLVDEVLAVGDAEFRQKCIQRIKAMREEGRAIIFISHNLAQMRAVCSRGIFLHSGQIQYEGSISDTINTYETWLRHKALKSNGKSTPGLKKGQPVFQLNLLGVDFFDLDGRPQVDFEHDQGMEIRIHYWAAQKFQNFRLVVSILRTDGMVCAVVRSSDMGLTLGDLDGYGQISLRLNRLQLATGSYLVEVRIRDSEDAVTLAQTGSSDFWVKGLGEVIESEGGVYHPDILGAEVIPSAQAVEGLFGVAGAGS